MMPNKDTEILDDYIRDMIDAWLNTDWDFHVPTELTNSTEEQ